MLLSPGPLHRVRDPLLGASQYCQCGSVLGSRGIRTLALLCFFVVCCLDICQLHCCIIEMLHPVVLAS